MSSSLHKPAVAILFAAVLISSVGGEFEQWCVADPKTPDEDLLAALDWVCGTGGANCSMIQVDQPCYLPNTPKDHASFAFNSYYQKFKHRGCSCNFCSTAMVTDLDPIMVLAVRLFSLRNLYQGTDDDQAMERPEIVV